MPRGRVKQILHTAEFRTVSSRGRLPLCSGDRRNHRLERGDKFLRIKDGLNEKNYCLVCAQLILERGQARLDELISELDARPPRQRQPP